MLWQEVSSYDLEAEEGHLGGQPEGDPQPVHQQSRNLPTQQVGDSAQQHSSPRRLTLEVPDELLVVELTTSKGGDLREVTEFSERSRR